MTDRLLRRACRFAKRWPAEATSACKVSLLQQRDHGLPAMVQAALDSAGFPTRRLELEITESALVDDLDLARTLLGKLKALRVRPVLDHFGAGYSSLRLLQLRPFARSRSTWVSWVPWSPTQKAARAPPP